MIKKTIEIWADSFHEGEWCCDSIVDFANKGGFSCSKNYINGFIPQYKIINKEIELTIEVFGSYNAWTKLPKKIVDLLKWGKPDFIAYSRDDDEIIFAVEETSATMTGNQPTQRCERQYGSARSKIPFWYLVSEFGVHLDGGVRRDSIWPTIAAMKLSMHFEVPSIVLHYSQQEAPEDYSSGNGMGLLFESLYNVIIATIKKEKLITIKDIIKKQYQDMIDFVRSQWGNMVDFIPSEEKFNNSKTAEYITDFALGNKNAVGNNLDGFLEWPTINKINSEVKEKWRKSELLTFNKLCSLFEEDIESKKAYYLSNNSSSGKPISEGQVVSFLEQQKKAFNSEPKLIPEASFDMNLSDFSKTINGNYNLTTSKNILYLYDSWFELRKTILKAYPRLKDKLNKIDEDKAAVVYISNSLKPRRVFGDPFTGQLAAYSTIFGKFDKNDRVIIAYYPHQSYTFYNSIKRGNKGKTIINELTDYVLFAGGIAIDVSNGGIL